MELIPILSTIILVATISTFFLAIGAYFLYKIREARGQQAAVIVPSTVKAELLTPSEQSRPAPQPSYIEQRSNQYVPSRERSYSNLPQNEQPRQYKEQEPTGRSYQVPKTKAGARYLKYTSEGYEPVTGKKEEKNSGTLKWK